MAYSEIQKLETRHRENPDGRTFAPLADAYRRAGRLEEAHQLVQAGLVKHPQYVSAHIVLGRCLIDMGDRAGARLAFEQVYALDSENIIALRALSELAEGEQRLDDAEYWLRQALDVDPMNPDIRDGLDRITAARSASPEPESAEVDLEVMAELTDDELAAGGPPALEGAEQRVEPAIETGVAEEEALGGVTGPERVDAESGDLVIERGAPVEAADVPPVPAPELDLDLELERVGEEEPEAPGVEPASEVADVEIERVSDEPPTRAAQPWMPVGIDAGSIVPFDGRIDFSQVEPPGGAPLEIEPDEAERPDVGEADVTPVEGLAGTQFETMGVAETPPEQAQPGEARGAGAAAEVDELLDLEEPAVEGGGADDEAREAAAADLGALFGEPQGARERADSALADLPVFIPDEVEESAGQRAVEEDYHAADHEVLEAAEPVVTETMAELLVSQGHVEEAIRVYRALLTARPGDPMLERRLAKLEGRPAPGTGQTVRELFRELVAAEGVPVEKPAALEPAPARSEEPTPLSGDRAAGPPPLSLDEVFGGAESGPSEAPAQASEPARPAGPAGGSKDPDEFSFDAFFGGETAPPEQGAEPDADPESDLDEFQAWLRGLKS